MADYFNAGLAILTILIGLVVLTNIKKGGYLGFFGVLIAINIFLFFDNKESEKESIIFFKNGVDLKCRNANSIYLVSKKDNYIYKKGYFIKDSLLIHPVNCEKLSDK